MPTNAELAEQLKEKRAEIDELKRQLDEQQQQSAPTGTGLSGWIIKTPNPNFNGWRLGVMFRNGKAIMLDDDSERKLKKLGDVQDLKKREDLKNDLIANSAARKALLFEHDFGHEVTRVENLSELPEAVERMNKTMVDILTR